MLKDIYSEKNRSLLGVSLVRILLWRGLKLQDGKKKREMEGFPHRDTMLFQRLWDVYKASPTSYRCLLSIEMTPSVYWVGSRVLWMVCYNQKLLFVGSVIDLARLDKYVLGLFYQNDIESIHYIQKQSTKLEKAR